MCNRSIQINNSLRGARTSNGWGFSIGYTRPAAELKLWAMK